MINEFLFNSFFIFLQRVFGPVHGDSLLLETGDYLLLETGDSILLE